MCIRWEAPFSKQRLMYKKEADNLVKTLREAKSNFEKHDACDDLFRYFHYLQTDSLEKATACADAGAITAFLNVSRVAVSSVRCQALRCLGQMCCFNESVSTRTAEDPLFITTLNELLPVDRGREFGCDVFYVLNVVAADSWRSHKVVQQFIHGCTDILAEQTIHSRGTIGNCIRFIGQLAYNKENETVLRESNVVPFLTDVMQSMDVALGCISATFAIANICRGADETLATCGKKMALTITIALSRTLSGGDFPENSSIYFDDWKIMISVSNLVRNPEIRCVLIENHLLDLVSEALFREDSHDLLVEHSLRVLWLMSREDQ